MEQISEQITQELLQHLPDKAEYFTPDVLLSAGIPYIVVESLRENIVSTLKSELDKPNSQWVQFDSKEVQASWNAFVDTSAKYIQIPATQISSLLQDVVEQCLELSLTPRQAVAELIFDASHIIDYENTKRRVQSLQVNKQLGVALLRYMEKKNINEITFEKACELISTVDQRLTENYHPLNWAQILKPVFDLAGPTVDTELFRIFFHDKEMPIYARKFDQMDGELNESEFIETLTSADLLDIHDYDADQPEYFVPKEEETEPEEVARIENPTAEEIDIPVEESDEFEEESIQNTAESEDVLIEDSESIAESTHEDLEPTRRLQEEQGAVDESFEEHVDVDAEGEQDRHENIVDLFSQIREDDLFEADQDEEVLSLVEDEDEEKEEKITLISKFTLDESESNFSNDNQTEPDNAEDSDEKEPVSIYEEMNLVKDDLTNIQKKKSPAEESNDIDDEEQEEELSFKIHDQEHEEIVNESDWEDNQDDAPEIEGSEEEGEDQPMWRSFLERSDLEIESGYEYEEDLENEETEQIEDNEGFIEEPIYDLTQEEEDPEKKIEQISTWLDDEKERFIEEIFMGSEMAYEQALLEIMEFDNWKAASLYLEKEVFSRNKVDVYDEAAVDFTDRLHSFFLQDNSK